MTEQALTKSRVEDTKAGKVTDGDLKVNEVTMSTAARDKVTTKQLLVLTWVVLIALAGNIVAGMIWISSVSDNPMWARIVYSLAVSMGLILLACLLLYVLSRIRMEG